MIYRMLLLGFTIPVFIELIPIQVQRKIHLPKQALRYFY